jgi:hypothetical protein
MTDNNFLTYSVKIILQIFGEILYFPWWWYSTGFARWLIVLSKFWLNLEKVLGLGVWVKNIFVPMYGQRDLASRAISFVMRLIQIIIRGLALLFCSAIILSLAILWLALPVFLIFALSYQL